MIKSVKPSQNGNTLILNTNQEQYQYLFELGVETLNIYSFELEKGITVQFNKELIAYVVVGLNQEDLELLYKFGNGNYIFV